MTLTGRLLADPQVRTALNRYTALIIAYNVDAPYRLEDFEEFNRQYGEIESALVTALLTALGGVSDAEAMDNAVDVRRGVRNVA